MKKAFSCIDVKYFFDIILAIAMSKDEKQTIKGIVVESLPNTMFLVQPEGTDSEGERILAYLAGKMKLYRIRVLVGDTVEVLLDPYGGKGRIIKRL